MEPNQVAAFKLIEQAQQAMKSGEQNKARQLAAQAAQSAPELEEVWLIMAALASPRGSVAFLQKALDINPQSERAQKGMQWAQKRYQQELDKQAATRQAAAEAPTVVLPPEEPQAVASSEPVIEKPVAAISESEETPIEEEKPAVQASQEEKPIPAATPAVLEPKTSPRKQVISTTVVAKEIQGEKAATNRRSSSLLIPLIAVGALALISVLFLILVSFTPAAALINSTVFNGQAHGPAWAQVNVAKPDTGQSEAGSVIVQTATPEGVGPAAELPIPPTATLAPLATETPLPANTPVPVEILPLPTETPVPATATPIPTASPTATVEVAAVEGPSPTPLPTDTAMPGPTAYVASTAVANSGGNNAVAGASGERWIDVDLTHQMVYAFQGNAVVNSFLVSTGTWQHPTVTGQYHVYVKYRSTTMSGPGYSLPNVPFTMYFYKGYGLHGTYWHSNFGTPMSHGCVNLSIPDSEWLYNWASVGTLVNVHY